MVATARLGRLRLVMAAGLVVGPRQRTVLAAAAAARLLLAEPVQRPRHLRHLAPEGLRHIFHPEAHIRRQEAPVSGGAAAELIRSRKTPLTVVVAAVA